MSATGWRRAGSAPGGRGFGLGPAGPVPPMVKALIAVNFAVYVVQAFGGRFALISNFALIPALVARGEVWRLFTYQFLHGGVWHLAINMLMLWMFGSELEQRWGQRFFLKYYFLCAIGGGAVFTAAMYLFGDPTVISVGASGGIYGILMAYGMWFPNREVLIWLLFPVKVKYLVIFLIAIEFVQSIEASGGGIAHAAHFGGMAIGYAYLRWWGASGLGVPQLPTWSSLKRSYYKWKFRRLQKKRLGGGDNGITYH